jgi:hypothetical protein
MSHEPLRPKDESVGRLAEVRTRTRTRTHPLPDPTATGC